MFSDLIPVVFFSAGAGHIARIIDSLVGKLKKTFLVQAELLGYGIKSLLKTFFSYHSAEIKYYCSYLHAFPCNY